MTERYLTLDEAAEHFGVSVAEIYRLVRSGRLPGIKLANNQGWRLSETAVTRYLRHRENTAEGTTGESAHSASDAPNREKTLTAVRNLVLNSTSAGERAALLYALVRTVYDTTKIYFADDGHADTDERMSMGLVGDKARDHEDAMFAAERRPADDPLVTQLTEQIAIDAAFARADPSEARQTLINQPQDGDDDEIGLTQLHGLKCAAIVQAFADGHELYRDAAWNVASYIQALAAR